MFAKLIKHEWRNCRQILSTLCLITLGSGLMVGLTTVYLTRTEGQRSYMLAIFLMMLAMMVIGICTAVGILYLFWRFYQSRFTDEGYLTFTLPVNTHQQLFAAMVNILRGGCLVFLAAMGAGLLVALIWCLAFFPRDADWTELFQAFGRYLPEFWNGINWMGCLEVLVFALVWLLRNVIELMLSITLGAVLARKHRFLTTIAVYYGIGIVQLWGLFACGAGSSGRGFLRYELFVSLLTIAAGYFLMHFTLEKKLNLT